jgi:hypothetical protein
MIYTFSGHVYVEIEADNEREAWALFEEEGMETIVSQVDCWGEEEDEEDE